MNKLQKLDYVIQELENEVIYCKKFIVFISKLKICQRIIRKLLKRFKIIMN